MEGTLPRKIKTIGLRPTIVFKEPPMMPSLRAQMEIERLRTDPEYRQESCFGVRRPPEMEAENARRARVRRDKELEIIERYGVAEEYLAPLFREEKRLANKLAGVREEIEELQHIKEKKA